MLRLCTSRSLLNLYIMKKLFGIAFFSLLLCSCSKNADLFGGDYSYKTSGSVSVTLGTSGKMDIHLSNEIGTMTIERLYKDRDDSVLIIKNKFSGGVTVMKAASLGDSLVLVPYYKSFDLLIGSNNYAVNVKVTGIGHLYNESLVFKEVYDGSLTADNIPAGVINGNDIITVGQRND